MERFLNFLFLLYVMYGLKIYFSKLLPVDDCRMMRRLSEHTVAQHCPVNWGALPDELLSKILIKLPSEYLWDVCRYVCKGWLRVISEPLFMNSSMSDPSFVFILCVLRKTSLAHFVSDLSSSPKFELMDMQFQYKGLARASCDGILLFSRPIGLYVVNPLIGQGFYLPSPTTEQNVKLERRRSTITRVRETGKFMVVCVGREGLSRRFGWFVLTIGTNMSWSKICNINEEWSGAYLISVDGVVYGYPRRVHAHYHTQSIRAIDLRGDKPRTCRLPFPAVNKRGIMAGCWLVPIGRSHLGVVNAENDEGEIWMLKDLYERKWEMVKSIKFHNPPYMMSRNSCHFEFLLECGNILLVNPQSSREAVAYFANTGEWQTIYTKMPAVTLLFMHSCSLIHLF